MSFSTDKFSTIASDYPKKFNEKFLYGTSGVRSLGVKLDSTLFRFGIIAAIRSQSKNGQAIGLMVTASHNPSSDNGVKLIDSHGSMLDEEWEPICTQIVNLPDEKLEQGIRDLITNCNASGPSSVFIGTDTRETSSRLAKAATDGAKLLDAEVRHFGLLTTPQLHYIVYSFNRNEGDPTELGYYNKISAAFKDLCSSLKNIPSNYVPILNLDCSNGIGAVAMKKIAPLLEPYIQFKLCNTSGMVNDDCGSNYVATTVQPPAGYTLENNELWASFDGDADRVVFYYQNSDSKFCLLDGDKLAALFCLYIKELMTECELTEKLTLQVINTAYTNGKTTEFFKSIGVHVECTPTGVKHLMNRAVNCDISIWFESNGHGSIRFSDKAISLITETTKTDKTGSAVKLTKIFDLMSQVTGDAIGDMLLAEVILRAKDWDPKNWDAIYTTYPSRLLKLKVPNRYFIKTNDIATVILEPAALQVDVNRIIDEAGPGSRAIVRASGTEDIVRVYAESTTHDKADDLAQKIVQLVEKYAKLQTD